MKKTEERISYQKTQKKNETEEKNIKTKEKQKDKRGYNQWTRMSPEKEKLQIQKYSLQRNISTSTFSAWYYVIHNFLQTKYGFWHRYISVTSV